eukprot:6193310-Pleurochrysis_carterae.AAC.1
MAALCVWREGLHHPALAAASSSRACIRSVRVAPCAQMLYDGKPVELNAEQARRGGGARCLRCSIEARGWQE